MKKISIILIVVEIFICFDVFAQQPTLEWERRYPETGNGTAWSRSLALDDSGNVYVTGGIIDSLNKMKYCTIKYSSGGIRQWVVIFSGSNLGGRQAYSIALDLNRNVYVTGYSYNSGQSFDYCTIKYDNNGVEQWVRYYNGPISGLDEAHHLCCDNAGNVYVTGFCALLPIYNMQFATVKYSPDGRELWVRRYGNADLSTYANGLAIDDNNLNIYITGANDGKAVTLCYDSSGSLIWNQEYTGNVMNPTEATSIFLDSNNFVYIAGYSTTHNGNVSHTDFFTIKYSTSGAQQWVRRYNPDSLTSGSQYRAANVVADNSGNVYVNGAGQANQDSSAYLHTIKYSSSGILLWARKDTASLSGGPILMELDKDVNIYVTGSASYPNPSMIKYNDQGDLLWRKDFNSASFFFDLKVREDYSIYLTGDYKYPNPQTALTLKYNQAIGLIGINKNIPKEFKLQQNYPNPFNPETGIIFAIPKATYVSIKVYNILSQLITVLVNNEFKDAGRYSVKFDGSSYASGIYFYSMESEKFTETKKMILLK